MRFFLIRLSVRIIPAHKKTGTNKRPVHTWRSDLRNVQILISAARFSDILPGSYLRSPEQSPGSSQFCTRLGRILPLADLPIIQDMSGNVKHLFEFFEKIVKKFWLFRPKGILPCRAGIE